MVVFVWEGEGVQALLSPYLLSPYYIGPHPSSLSGSHWRNDSTLRYLVSTQHSRTKKQNLRVLICRTTHPHPIPSHHLNALLLHESDEARFDVAWEQNVSFMTWFRCQVADSDSYGGVRLKGSLSGSPWRNDSPLYLSCIHTTLSYQHTTFGYSLLDHAAPSPSHPIISTLCFCLLHESDEARCCVRARFTHSWRGFVVITIISGLCEEMTLWLVALVV